MVRKTAKGPLSWLELLVLQALVKRHVKSAGGTHILKVPAHARHHTYIRTAMAKKTANKVSSRQVYRRMDAVQEFSNLHGASLDGTALIQKKLSGRWANAESYQVNVPQLGTLELCCDMRASNCQLQVMRSHLTSWGLGSAQTMSITHPPIFWLGVDYCLPAPLHCNLGIVTNGMDALESLLVKF